MRRRLILIGGLATVGMIAVGFWWVFFSDDAPDAVDNAAANEQLDLELAEAQAQVGAEVGVDAEAQAETQAEPVSADVNRVWTVDTRIGEFDFDSASGSFAGFRVDEELTIGSAMAVGRTDGVTGSITIADGTLTGVDVVVDLTGIVSNESRRERAIQGALDTGEFPVASFVLTDPVELPDGIAVGETIEVEAVGDLTIHGVTNRATFVITANVRDDGIAVLTGSSPVVFHDFGVTPPSAPIVVSVADEGIIEFQLILT